MESQPQNPEFRINPENFHPCTTLPLSLHLIENWKGRSRKSPFACLIRFISYLSYLLHCCVLPDKRYLSQGMCIYQVIMTMHFLNDVANDTESTQKSKSMS